MRKFLWIIIPTLLVVICFFSIIGTSLAIYQYDKKGDTNNVVTSGTLEAIVEGFDNKLSLDTTNQPDNNNYANTYMFTIKNLGTLPLKYRIIVEDDDQIYSKDNCLNSKISLNSIAYSIETEDSKKTEGILENNIIIEQSILESMKEEKYILKIWNIDNNTQGHFHGKMKLEYIAESSSFTN